MLLMALDTDMQKANVAMQATGETLWPREDMLGALSRGEPLPLEACAVSTAERDMRDDLISHAQNLHNQTLTEGQAPYDALQAGVQAAVEETQLWGDAGWEVRAAARCWGFHHALALGAALIWGFRQGAGLWHLHTWCWCGGQGTGGSVKVWLHNTWQSSWTWGWGMSGQRVS